MRLFRKGDPPGPGATVKGLHQASWNCYNERCSIVMVSHVKPRALLRPVSDEAKRPFVARIPQPWQTSTVCVKPWQGHQTERLGLEF